MAWDDSWPSETIRLAEQGLDELERTVRELSATTDDEVVSAMTRFLVLRSCGYLEQVLEAGLRAHFQANAGLRVASYAASTLARGGNPNPDYLKKLFKSLDPAWATELAFLLDDDGQELRTNLRFLVELRNTIAHGGSETIGRRRAYDLVRTSREIADWLIRRLDPRQAM